MVLPSQIDSEVMSCDLSSLLDVFSECGDAFMDIAQSLRDLEDAVALDNLSLPQGVDAAVAMLKEGEEDRSFCDMIGPFLQSEQYWEEILAMNIKVISKISGAIENQLCYFFCTNEYFRICPIRR